MQKSVPKLVGIHCDRQLLTASPGQSVNSQKQEPTAARCECELENADGSIRLIVLWNRLWNPTVSLQLRLDPRRRYPRMQASSPVEGRSIDQSREQRRHLGYKAAYRRGTRQLPLLSSPLHDPKVARSNTSPSHRENLDS